MTHQVEDPSPPEDAGQWDAGRMDAGPVERSPGRAAARGGGLSMLGELGQRTAQTVTFFVLAGVLSPREFGLAAVAFLAVQVANSVTYAGFGYAVQALGEDVRRDRTAVTLAWLSGSAGAAAMVLLAGPLCDLVQAPQAVGLVRLVAVSLPITQAAEVVGALLDRDFRFGTTATAMLVGSLLSLVFGVTLAVAGAGPVALIAQTLVLQTVRLVVLTARRRSSLHLGLHRAEARELWQLGRQLLVTTVFTTAYSNADNATVGYVAGPAPLGAYGFVFNLTNLPFFLVGMALNRVFLPTYARLLRAGQPLAGSYRAAVTAISCLAALPLGFLLLAGPPALEVIFGPKWTAAYGALRVLAFYAWMRTVAGASAPLFTALHRVRVLRRIQQWQLVGLLVLVYPLTWAWSTTGTAVAVTAPTVAGTLVVVRQSLRATAGSTAAASAGIALGAAAGVAGGWSALLLLGAHPSLPGLIAALLVDTLVWSAALLLLGGRDVRQRARRLLPLSRG
jgi:PST family polysaccharide transporter